tara:strand:+ start:398 stop:679 length:282 start_codon:yes stop_codon:yes gene_type:complete
MKINDFTDYIVEQPTPPAGTPMGAVPSTSPGQKMQQDREAQATAQLMQTKMQRKQDLTTRVKELQQQKLDIDKQKMEIDKQISELQKTIGTIK